MRYAEQRAILKRRGVANADLLSPAYIARLFGMPSPSAPEPSSIPAPRQPVAYGRLEPKASLPFTVAERKALDRMSTKQRAMYLAIREAAEERKEAPTDAALMAVGSLAGKQENSRAALKRLKEMGAIVQTQGGRGHRIAFRLPLAGLETQRR